MDVLDRMSGAGAWMRGVLALAALVVASGARGDTREPFRIVKVEAARNDSVLVCSVRSHGLPPPESRSTLESGLPSSLVIDLAVVATSGDEILGRRTEIRLEPDLWEGLFHVRTPFIDHRCESMDALTDRLRLLGPFPLATLVSLRTIEAEDIRIRARVAVHALAPDEKRGLVSLFRDEDGVGRRESSAGIGRLFRFFLGRDENEPWVSEAHSAPFSLDRLPAWNAAADSAAAGSPAVDLN